MSGSDPNEARREAQDRFALRTGAYAGLSLAGTSLFICFICLILFIIKFTSNDYMGMTKFDFSVMSKDHFDILEILALRHIHRHVTVMARLGLQLCGLVAGVATAFLGFSLFLVGIQNQMKIGFQHGDYKLTMAHMAPGSSTTLVAAAIIYGCVSLGTHDDAIPDSDYLKAADQVNTKAEKGSSNTRPPASVTRDRNGDEGPKRDAARESDEDSGA